MHTNERRFVFFLSTKFVKKTKTKLVSFEIRAKSKALVENSQRKQTLLEEPMKGLKSLD